MGLWPTDNMHYVYFIKSERNRKIYVGFTEKMPIDRLTEHNKGANKWTKENGPFKLVYYEAYICESDARRRELFYKSGFGKSIKKAIVEYLDK